MSSWTETFLTWSIADEYNRVRVQKMDEAIYLSNWDIHYGDECWGRFMYHVGYTEQINGIKSRESISNITKIFVSLGAIVDVVLLSFNCAVIYVSDLNSLRTARFFAFQQNQKAYLVYFSQHSKTGYSEMYVAVDEIGIHSVGYWVVHGGDLREYPNGE